MTRGKDSEPVSVFDVAKYVLKKTGPISTMKLQKLVYYCQAWSLVWDEKPLFPEEIQAWADGPVVYELWKSHRGKFQIGPSGLPKGSADRLCGEQRETIDAVVGGYGKLSGLQMSIMAHNEEPWKQARKGLPDGASCSRVIDLDVMQEFYTQRYAEHAQA
jgi:uncharacterized phage-associated protein